MGVSSLVIASLLLSPLSDAVRSAKLGAAGAVVSADGVLFVTERLVRLAATLPAKSWVLFVPAVYETVTLSVSATALAKVNVMVLLTVFTETPLTVMDVKPFLVTVKSVVAGVVFARSSS